MKIVLFLENGKAFEFKNIKDLGEYEKNNLVHVHRQRRQYTDECKI